MNKSILVLRSILTLTFLSVLTVSCSDDNDDDICNDPIVGELTEYEADFSGYWTLKSIVVDEEIDLTDDDIDNPSSDVYSQYDECLQDTAYEFSSDRAYSFEQGKNADDCEVQNETNGTWKLGQDNILTIVSNCLTGNTVLDLNDDLTEFSFKSSLPYEDVNGNKLNLNTVSTYEKTSN
ncbi:DUF5004 domain-containing protein [Tamlana sp. 2_MG-2023]|uniref:DUF5004 domain-containing protein n=1 Tax=unclassified Tamlana TaxID=2614803 RepID=UPI0026E12410|nr:MULTISPECIES: DUF5004 domain-containing protein [unclassified Tamlana]MDO6758856.1 DUF5004 domain-containing protein [Tamlana sp. 2_MG-2023]MDO6789555.1 DUF5004 domain-containing protein [Tamlana sp. 1_MG-2023]